MTDGADPAGADVIRGLAELQREVGALLDHAVVDGRAHHDLSWTQVAELVGMSRRGAIKRWADVAPGTRPQGGQTSEHR